MASNLACFPSDSVRVCKLSGTEAKIKKSQLLNLKDCEKMLLQCEKEAISARTQYQWFRFAEISARIVLIACDIAIITLEQKVGPAGIAVAKLYSGGKLVVSALSNGIDDKTAFIMLFENKASIASLATEMGGSKNAKTAIDSAKNLVSLATTLWDQVSGASKGKDGGEGIDSAIIMVRSQLSRIRIQVKTLEAELLDC